MADNAEPNRRVPIIPRAEAFRLIGWSRSTGKRRERTDPNIPARIAIGPARYGYRLDEWEQYMATLPRVRTAPQVSVALADKGRKAGLASGVARRIALPDVGSQCDRAHEGAGDGRDNVDHIGDRDGEGPVGGRDRGLHIGGVGGPAGVGLVGGVAPKRRTRHGKVASKGVAR